MLGRGGVRWSWRFGRETTCEMKSKNEILRIWEYTKNKWGALSNCLEQLLHTPTIDPYIEMK